MSRVSRVRGGGRMLRVKETGLGVWGTDATERWVAGERRGLLVLLPSEARVQT